MASPTVARGPVLRVTNTMVLAGMVLLTLALRAPFLSVPLGLDEGGLAFIAKAWGPGHGSLYGAYWVDRPPVLLGLFKVAILGGAYGVRVLGALAACALVVLAFAAGRRLGGETVARIAALLTAAMASSKGLLAIYTPAELLASVPAAGCVLCLLKARDGEERWLIAAGFLAVTAALVKQSFLDAGFATAAFVAITWWSDRRIRIRVLALVAGGAVLPLLAVLAWLALSGHSVGQLAYALIGFRIDGLTALAHSDISILHRLDGLGRPALRSGIVVALALAPPGLWRLRADRVKAVTLAAWLFAGLVGVLGGGSYWPHYLIQLVVPLAVLTAVGLAPFARLRWVAAGAIAVTVFAVNLHDARYPNTRAADLAVARYVRDHAAPGDTQYVQYAHASVDYYTGLQSPFPYAWSLMMRAIPDAPARLAQLLASPRRPTWVVQWQPASHWSLDPHHAIARALHRDYSVAAIVRGHRIYHALPEA